MKSARLNPHLYGELDAQVEGFYAAPITDRDSGQDVLYALAHYDPKNELHAEGIRRLLATQAEIHGIKPESVESFLRQIGPGKPFRAIVAISCCAQPEVVGLIVTGNSPAGEPVIFEDIVAGKGTARMLMGEALILSAFKYGYKGLCLAMMDDNKKSQKLCLEFSDVFEWKNSSPVWRVNAYDMLSVHSKEFYENQTGARQAEPDSSGWIRDVSRRLAEWWQAKSTFGGRSRENRSGGVYITVDARLSTLQPNRKIHCLVVDINENFSAGYFKEELMKSAQKLYFKNLGDEPEFEIRFTPHSMQKYPKYVESAETMLWNLGAKHTRMRFFALTREALQEAARKAAANRQTPSRSQPQPYSQTAATLQAA